MTELLATLSDIFIMRRVQQCVFNESRRQRLDDEFDSKFGEDAFDASFRFDPQTSDSTIVRSQSPPHYDKPAHIRIPSDIWGTYMIIWFLIGLDILIKLLIYLGYPLLFDSIITLTTIAMRARANLQFGLVLQRVFDGSSLGGKERSLENHEIQNEKQNQLLDSSAESNRNKWYSSIDGPATRVVASQGNLAEMYAIQQQQQLQLELQLQLQQNQLQQLQQQIQKQQLQQQQYLGQGHLFQYQHMRQSIRFSNDDYGSVSPTLTPHIEFPPSVSTFMAGSRLLRGSYVGSQPQQQLDSNCSQSFSPASPISSPSWYLGK